MPWAWEMARHCLDLQTGNVLHWPFPGQDWEANQFHLDAMIADWNAVRWVNTNVMDFKSGERDPAADAYYRYHDWLYDES